MPKITKRKAVFLSERVHKMLKQRASKNLRTLSAEVEALLANTK